MKEIQHLRTIKGLSREKLASLCGLTGQTIYRAEKSGNITLNNYNKIIKALQDYDTTLYLRGDLRRPDAVRNTKPNKKERAKKTLSIKVSKV